MAYTPQQQSNIRNTLGQISSTLSNISGMVKSNPSLTNQAYQGIVGATRQLQSGMSSYYNPQTKTWNLPNVSGFNPSNITPTMSAEDLRSLKGMYSVSPYVPTDPSAFVNSINIDVPEQQQLSPVDLKLQQLQSQQERYYNQIDDMPAVYKKLRDDAGITQGLAELQNVNKQILQKKLEFEQTNKQIGGQTIPTPIILKQQEVNRSAAVAEIAAYSAYAQSLQGNIAMASNLIDKSIDIEYMPILARINYIKEQIKDINDKRTPFVQAQLDIYKSQVLDFVGQKRNAMNNAIFNKAPQSIFTAIQKSQTMEDLARVGGSYIRDPKTVAEIAKIYSDIETDVDPAMVIAYAQQYASTGTIPTGLPKRIFGAVSQVAKELPKPNGTVVDVNTGIKSSKLSSAQMEGITTLADITQKTTQLKELVKDKTNGIIAGLTGKVFGSPDTQKYLDLRQEIIDLLARARTGAALTVSEEKFYASQLPGRVSNPIFGIFGQNPKKRIENFESKINGTLQTVLKSNGLSIYGYSTVKLGENTYVVGDIITGKDGSQGRVNPDGSITLLQ